MRSVSLFSGVGGMDLGLERAGITTVAMCEIDKNARSVLRHHWPDTPIHDDVTTFDARSLHGTVDLVHGGSPCQDLSVAGRRAGLGGERSGLFWHQCRIAAECAAPWVLWENVPGALSSGGGHDFAAVLWGLTGALPDVPDDGWRNMGCVVGPTRCVVWRVLDARWFGVAQRRRRVFVVSGPRTELRRAVQVLLEPESSDRDSRPSATAGQDIAGTLGGGSGSRGWAPDTDRMTFLPCVKVVRSGARDADGNLPPEVWAERDTAPTLNAMDNTGDTRATVLMPVAYPLTTRGRDDGAELEVGEADTYNALRSADGGSSLANRVLTPDLAVRRLTPVECERLMGWPDNWTAMRDDGLQADSSRYKQCGNGVVSNVAEWIGRRLIATT